MLDKISHILRGHPDAVRMFVDIAQVFHFWDDLIDKDAVITDDEVRLALWKSAVDLPSNPFYRDNFDSLQPMIIRAISNWQVATKFEQEPTPKRLQLAYAIRSDYLNILLHCAYLVGGKEWLDLMAPYVQEHWTHETYDMYLENLKKEKALRAGERVELLKARYADETPEYLKHGLPFFNAAWLGDTVESHADALYDLISPPEGGVLVDMGCGVGELGRQFLRIDPTITVHCVTNVPEQLKHIQPPLVGHLCDFHSTPLDNESVDTIVFNEAFGYGDINKLFKESSRLLKAGGVLCIKDWLRPDEWTTHEYKKWFSYWMYDLYSLDQLKTAAKGAGLELAEQKTFPTVSYEMYDKFISESSIMYRRYSNVEEDKSVTKHGAVFRFVKE